MEKEEKILVALELPVSIADKLDEAAKRVGGKKVFKWQIVAKALELFFRTDLSWEQSQKLARLHLTVYHMVKGEVNPVMIELDLASALNLRNKLDEKIKEVMK